MAAATSKSMPLSDVWQFYGERAPEVIRQAISSFYGVVVVDERTEPYFRNTNIKMLKRHQFEALSFVLGGPSSYQSVDELKAALTLAHKGGYDPVTKRELQGVRHADTGRGINKDAYYVTGHHLILAMLTAGFSPLVTANMVPLWVSLEPFIVNDYTTV